MEDKEKQSGTILHINFNQDYSAFAIGTETGYSIYNLNPFHLKYSRALGGGIGQCYMYERTSIIFLVGGGKSPKYPPNKLQMWNDKELNVAASMNFKSDIKGVKINKDRVVVILQDKIFIYQFEDLKLQDNLDTCNNISGLASINIQGNDFILAYPSMEENNELGKLTIQFYSKNKAVKIKAHQTMLGHIQLNSHGSKVATASQKGTVIRIYNTDTGDRIQELRRGQEYAQIYSITFDISQRFVLVSSDTGTVHLFALNLNEQEQKMAKEKYQLVSNPKSTFSFLRFMMPILGSEWSFAQFRIPDCKAYSCLGQGPDQIVCVTGEGNYYLAQFDQTKGGNSLKQQTTKFFNVIAEEE